MPLADTTLTVELKRESLLDNLYQVEPHLIASLGLVWVNLLDVKVCTNLKGCVMSYFIHLSALNSALPPGAPPHRAAQLLLYGAIAVCWSHMKTWRCQLIASRAIFQRQFKSCHSWKRNKTKLSKSVEVLFCFSPSRFCVLMSQSCLSYQLQPLSRTN